MLQYIHDRDVQPPARVSASGKRISRLKTHAPFASHEIESKRERQKTGEERRAATQRDGTKKKKKNIRKNSGRDWRDESGNKCRDLPTTFQPSGPPPRSGQGGKGDVLYGPRYSPHFLLSWKGSGFPDSARITKVRELKESNVCVGVGKRDEGEKRRAKLVFICSSNSASSAFGGGVQHH